MGEEYLYSDSNMVYRNKNGIFYKVYDFNLQPGDSMQFYWDGIPFQCDSIGLMRVDSIGTTTINSITLKYQKVSVFDDYFLQWWGPYTITERIGSTGFMFFYRYSCSAVIVDGDSYEPLRCYFDSSFGMYNTNPPYSCDDILQVNEIEFENSLSLSPNPATNQITIDSKQYTKGEIEIFDVMGKQVGNRQSAVSNKTQIDISFLKKGVYFLQVKSENGKAVKKFVKL